MLMKLLVVGLILIGYDVFCSIGDKLFLSEEEAK